MFSGTHGHEVVIPPPPPKPPKPVVMLNAKSAVDLLAWSARMNSLAAMNDYQTASQKELDKSKPTCHGFFGCIGDFVSKHRVIIGVGLGVLAVASGGVGLLAGAAIEGSLLATTADIVAVAAGVGAAQIDAGSCRAGNRVACVGAGLGYIGAAFAAPAAVGDIVGVGATTTARTILGISSEIGLLAGATEAMIDYVDGLAHSVHR